MSHSKYTRREFVGSLPCLALGTSTLFSSLINLKAMNSLMGTTTVGDDYKAIVCLMMSGGNDSYNMVIPTSTNEYSEYATVRSNLAISRNEILGINPTNGDGRTFGLHPSMTNLRQLFDNGNLAIVNNVGTLVEPSTKPQIEGNQVQVPLGLFSHSDQLMHWQTGMAGERIAEGWGGRMADILSAMNTNTGVSMNISLAGNNVFQRGETITEYAINSDGGVAIVGWDTPLPLFQQIQKDVTDMMGQQYEDIFQKSYVNTLRRSVESNVVFNSAVQNVELATQFSQTNLSMNMNMIARAISSRDPLGAKRQIFFVDIGGFDNHDELINNHAALMTQVDLALSEFYAATVELGVQDCVTTFTVSDFARTLTSNGNGTDHAWGGNALVMGGAVKGQRMYGDYPILSLGTDLELGRGRLLPTTSADEYFAEIALWFGISPNDLSLILPNIGNFYSASSGEAPLGFLL